MSNTLPAERIQNKIFLIRGQKVMIDRDLAELYGVETFNLNKAVKRNISRFPEDFMFRLTKKEYSSLRFQNGILKRGRHSKYLPFAFTEFGVAMLSSVLKSRRAIQVNIGIMRAFARLRQVLSTHKELARKLEELEGRVDRQDANIVGIIEKIRELIRFEKGPQKRIGFLR